MDWHAEIKCLEETQVIEKDLSIAKFPVSTTFVEWISFKNPWSIQCALFPFTSLSERLMHISNKYTFKRDFAMIYSAFEKPVYYFSFSSKYHLKDTTYQN